MARIDTKSIDGLRGLASLHVALGHLFMFSQAPTTGNVKSSKLISNILLTLL